MSDEAWVRIERRFDAPIDRVWQMWTDAALFQQWYGPKGMQVPVAKMDVTPGGQRRICMEMVTPDRTMQMWFTGVYKEINPPHRLVYTEAMCDAEGVLIPPEAMEMPEGTPQVTEVIVDLEEDGEGTRMVMVHVGVPDGSPGAGGWQQAFDTLETVLAS